jgi:hypothetical protein
MLSGASRHEASPPSYARLIQSWGEAPLPQSNKKESMAVKVLMTWDIAGERDQEYFEFIIGEFIPGVQRLGLQPAEAWATLYGSYPQIQVGLLANDESQARRILGSGDWSVLQDKLFRYVQNFSYKVVLAKPGFQF